MPSGATETEEGMSVSILCKEPRKCRVITSLSVCAAKSIAGNMKCRGKIWGRGVYALYPILFASYSASIYVVPLLALDQVLVVQIFRAVSAQPLLVSPKCSWFPPSKVSFVHTLRQASAQSSFV